jgi:hypothetical protein
MIVIFFAIVSVDLYHSTSIGTIHSKVHSVLAITNGLFCHNHFASNSHCWFRPIANVPGTPQYPVV